MYQLMKNHGVCTALIRCALGVTAMALIANSTPGQKRGTATAAAGATKTIRLQTAPNAIVWVDEIKRGTADASGRLDLTKVSSRAHVVRVRVPGFKEVTRNVAPPIPATLEIRATLKADPAELAFQQAEAAVLTAKDDTARQAVVDLYEKALAARPNYPAARVGLARVLSDLGDHDAALEEIANARRARPNYAEASAVEGRIKRSINDETGAAAAFRRAIREGRGFQPEAHTGLALVYQDQDQYEQAIPEFEAAIAQLSDSEPLLYQLLGAAYEKMEKYKEAVAAYDKYLALAPDGNLAPAIRSTIDQLRRQANGELLLP
jgi:lipopolysaccharide biosynthesis regulator YciM